MGMKAGCPARAANRTDNCRFLTYQAEWQGMETYSGVIHKTYNYKLKPTSTQTQALEAVLWRCRVLYNTALEQRRTWWGRGQGISASYYQQKPSCPT
jgi:hypothetical protein